MKKCKGHIVGHITGQPLGHMKQFAADNAWIAGHVRPVDMGHTFLKI